MRLSSNAHWRPYSLPPCPYSALVLRGSAKEEVTSPHACARTRTRPPTHTPRPGTDKQAGRHRRAPLAS